jgi:hypothetical protein
MFVPHINDLFSGLSPSSHSLPPDDYLLGRSQWFLHPGHPEKLLVLLLNVFEAYFPIYTRTDGSYG